MDNFNMKNKIIKRVGFIIGGVILAAGLAFLFGFIVLYLWNWLMPAIFGLPTITYIQAWGLVLLSHILFKGGNGGHGGHKQGGRYGWKHGHRHHNHCEPKEEMKNRFNMNEDIKEDI